MNNEAFISNAPRIIAALKRGIDFRTGTCNTMKHYPKSLKDELEEDKALLIELTKAYQFIEKES